MTISTIIIAIISGGLMGVIMGGILVIYARFLSKRK